MSRSISPAVIGKLALAAVLLVMPFYLDAFWLQLGLFGFASAVAALGLTLLLGQAGMLSLGHAFFVFLDAETDEVSVVYRRANGGYGVIQPVIDRGNGGSR